MNYQDILREIKENSAEKQKAFSQKLTPTADLIYGTPLPVLRKIAKRVAKEDAYVVLAHSKNSFEEKMLHGFVIGYMKVSCADTARMIREFAPMVDNWAVCDSCAATFKLIGKNKDFFLPMISDFLASGEQFICRLGLVLLLDYYIQDEYAEYIFNACDNAYPRVYYVQMAVSWLVSTCYVKLKYQTEQYLHKNKLDAFTLNKSIQKITESYRVAEDDKQRLKKLKVKS